MSPIFFKLIAHLAWADAAVISAMKQTPALAGEWLELLGHVLGAEHTWLARIEGRPAAVAVWPALSLAECATLARENAEQFAALLKRLGPGDLQRNVRYRNSAGREFDSTVEDILLHICLHGSYHRGQIARAVRQGGAEPMPTDYIGFIRGVPAATRR